MEDLLVMVSIIIYYSEPLQDKKLSMQGAEPRIEREKIDGVSRSNSCELATLAEPLSPASWQ